jgi:two-component system, OmpR family, sensor histidine kinase QseC
VQDRPNDPLDGTEAPLSVAQDGLKGRCYRSIARIAAAIWLILSAALLIVANHQTTAAFDLSLREIASTLLAFSAHELAEIRAEGGPPVAEQLQNDADRLIYQVWAKDGSLAYRSGSAPAAPLASIPGFGTTTLEGIDLRTFTAWNDEHTFQIQIAASLAERTVYFMALSVGLSLALLLTFVIFMSLVRRQLDRSFRPLEATARLLADKSTDDLSAIGTPKELPEIAPVIDAFNKLMTRVDRSMRQERRFADDAAHALRTPLTSLKILVGNLQRAPTEGARHETLGMINGVIERSSAHVNQLLRLARIDREPNAIDLHERIDLVALAQAVIDEFAALAAERSLYLRRSGSAKSVWIRGNQGTLSLALRSMVENAVSFVQRYGTVLVEVVLDPASNSALLRVHDDGPGVENDLQDRVFSLFFKADRDDTAHAGLGLPLVARIAQIHRGLAYVGVSTLLGGAMAVVRIPCPREEAADPYGPLTSISPSKFSGLEH